MAGERFAAIELNHGIRKVIITEDRQQAADEPARERTATAVTASHLVETLERRREQ
jgi:hypothetical protein